MPWLFTFREAHINDLAIAIHSLRDRLDWSDAYSTPDVQICSGCSRLLHQVGEGQTPVYNLQQEGSSIFLVVHHLTFQYTPRNHFR